MALRTVLIALVGMLAIVVAFYAVRGKTLAYENQAYGTRLTNLAVNGRFTGNRLEIDELTATAGDGSLSASGFISLAASDGYPMNLTATLDNARLARSDNIGARATGTLTLEKRAGQTALLSGDLQLPESRYRIVREGAAQVPALTGVRRKPPAGRPRVSGDGIAAVGGSLFDLIRLFHPNFSDDPAIQVLDDFSVPLQSNCTWRNHSTVNHSCRGPTPQPAKDQKNNQIP